MSAMQNTHDQRDDRTSPASVTADPDLPVRPGRRFVGRFALLQPANARRAGRRHRRIRPFNRPRADTDPARIRDRHPAAGTARRPARPPPHHSIQGRIARRRAARCRTLLFDRCLACREPRHRTHGHTGPGHRPCCGDPGAGSATRQGGRHGDDRPAARHTALARGERHRRRSRQLACCFRRRGRRHRPRRVRPAAAFTPLRTDHTNAIRRAARLVGNAMEKSWIATPRRAGARAAFGGVQRLLVDTSPAAARGPLSPGQLGGRCLRPGRCRRCAGRAAGRTLG